MNITTKYTNVNGTPKVLAKGGGKQRTVVWDLSKSTDWNHGTAAGALILAHGGYSATDEFTHDSNDAGTVHTFTANAFN